MLYGAFMKYVVSVWRACLCTHCEKCWNKHKSFGTYLQVWAYL